MANWDSLFGESEAAYFVFAKKSIFLVLSLTNNCTHSSLASHTFHFLISLLTNTTTTNQYYFPLLKVFFLLPMSTHVFLSRSKRTLYYYSSVWFVCCELFKWLSSEIILILRVFHHHSFLWALFVHIIYDELRPQMYMGIVPFMFIDTYIIIRERKWIIMFSLDRFDVTIFSDFS